MTKTEQNLAIAKALGFKKDYIKVKNGGRIVEKIPYWIPPNKYHNLRRASVMQALPDFVGLIDECIRQSVFYDYGIPHDFDTVEDTIRKR